MVDLTRRDMLKASLAAAASATLLNGQAEEAEAAPPKAAGKTDPIKERKDLVQPFIKAIVADEKTAERVPAKFKDEKRLADQATSRIDEYKVDGQTHYVATAFGEGHVGEEPNASGPSSGKTVPRKSEAKQLPSRLLVVDAQAEEVTFKESKGAITVEIDGKPLVSTKGSTNGQPITFGAKEHVSVVSPKHDPQKPLVLKLETVPPIRTDLLDDNINLDAQALPELSKPAKSFAKNGQVFTHGSGTVRLNISEPQLFATTYIAAAKKVGNSDAPGHYIGTNLVVGADAKGAQGGLVQLLPARYADVTNYNDPEKIRAPKDSMGNLQFQLNGKDVSTPIVIGQQVGVKDVVPPSLDDVAKGVEVEASKQEYARAALQWLLDQRYQMENGKPISYLRNGLQGAKEGEYTLGSFADNRINSALQNGNDYRTENGRPEFTGFGEGRGK